MQEKKSYWKYILIRKWRIILENYFLNGVEIITFLTRNNFIDI
jgi:hypothetical protein